ncbi:MAG: hypothetical protein UHC59_09400 [Fibrobacteraceae bacterium]|jgi:hypothetical protein|nr:hypothetical protein [Fibrobacteraceae bacterium]
MHKVFLLFLLFSLFSVTNAITISTLDEQFSQNKILGSIIEHSPHENSTKQAYDNFFENTFDWNLDFNFGSGSSVIFYVGNDFQWNGTIVANARSCQTANKFLVREPCHYETC